MNKNYIIVLFLCITFLCCKLLENKRKITIILCVPNNMTTYNMGKLTFEKEYKEYGLKIDTDNLDFENKLYKLLDTINTKRSGRNGLRIKIITSKKDTIYMPYLPNSSFRYNNKSLKNNKYLSDLVVNKIKNNYKKGNYICEGEKCSNSPNQENVKFLEMISK